MSITALIDRMNSLVESVESDSHTEAGYINVLDLSQALSEYLGATHPLPVREDVLDILDILKEALRKILSDAEEYAEVRYVQRFDGLYDIEVTPTICWEDSKMVRIEIQDCLESLHKLGIGVTPF